MFSDIISLFTFSFLPPVILIGIMALLVIRLAVLVVDVIGKILDAIPIL